MAKNRQATSYPGVTFLQTNDGEKIYYIRYRPAGEKKQVEEKIGKSTQGMTPAKASNLRGEKINGKILTNDQKRDKDRQDKIQKENENESAWTFKRLFMKYQETLKENGGRKSDRSNFKHIKRFADMQPSEVRTLDVQQLRIELEKIYKPGTVKHVLSLMTRIINYGVDTGLIDEPAKKQLVIKKPKVDNEKTEYLTDEVQTKLIEILEAEVTNKERKDIDGIVYIALILLTGIRKSAALAMRWSDFDFNLNRINLRGEDAKKAKSDYIPLRAEVKKWLSFLKRTGSPFLFPSPIYKDRHREGFKRIVEEIRTKAGFPEDFRPLHGLRHNLGCRLISSRKVTIYELRSLLTHERLESTSRYAKLSDDALRAAAEVAGEVIKKGSSCVSYCFRLRFWHEVSNEKQSIFLALGGTVQA